MSWLGLPPSGLGEALGKAATLLDEFDNTAHELIEEGVDDGSSEGSTRGSHMKFVCEGVKYPYILQVSLRRRMSSRQYQLHPQKTTLKLGLRSSTVTHLLQRMTLHGYQRHRRYSLQRTVGQQGQGPLIPISLRRPTNGLKAALDLS